MKSVDFLRASPPESQNLGSFEAFVAFEPGHSQSSGDKEKNSGKQKSIILDILDSYITEL